MRKFVSVKVDGNEYKLRFSINSMIELKEASGIDVFQAGGADFGKDANGDPDFVVLRSVFHAMLNDYHEGVTVKEAGLLMSDVGLADASLLISEVLSLSMPKPVDKPDPNSGGATGGKPRTRKKKAPA